MTDASDLDLVFIYTYDAKAARLRTAAKPLEPVEYFTRLAQRFISALTAQTARARFTTSTCASAPPATRGRCGASRYLRRIPHRAIVLDLGAHGAYARARGERAGQPLRREHRERDSRASLTRAVEPATIFADARAMRGKLSAQFPGRDAWDIKFAPGGLVDIEFIAQALQLLPRGRDAGCAGSRTRSAALGETRPPPASSTPGRSRRADRCGAP